jgi:hypothetical protein
VDFCRDLSVKFIIRLFLTGYWANDILETYQTVGFEHGYN